MPWLLGVALTAAEACAEAQARLALPAAVQPKATADMSEEVVGRRRWLPSTKQFWEKEAVPPPGVMQQWLCISLASACGRPLSQVRTQVGAALAATPGGPIDLPAALELEPLPELPLPTAQPSPQRPPAAQAAAAPASVPAPASSALPAAAAPAVSSAPAGPLMSPIDEHTAVGVVYIHGHLPGRRRRAGEVPAVVPDHPGMWSAAHGGTALPSTAQLTTDIPAAVSRTQASFTRCPVLGKKAVASLVAQRRQLAEAARVQSSEGAGAFTQPQGAGGTG